MPAMSSPHRPRPVKLAIPPYPEGVPLLDILSNIERQLRANTELLKTVSLLDFESQCNVYNAFDRTNRALRSCQQRMEQQLLYAQRVQEAVNNFHRAVKEAMTEGASSIKYSGKLEHDAKFLIEVQLKEK